MSTAAGHRNTDAPANSAARSRIPELVTAVILASLLVYLVVGIVTMDIPPGAEPPGPKVFPYIVVALTSALLVAQVVTLIRPPAPPQRSAGDGDATADDTPDGESADHVNGPAVAGAIVAFLAFSFVLEPLGWLLSAALLFTGVAWSLGSRALLTALGTGLAISSIVQLGFGGGLGLSLPPGILEGLF